MIELMIALVISIIVIGGIYQTFTNQNKSYIIQEGIVEMQQTLRGALMLLERDIRSAGLNPQDALPDFGITTATDQSFGFTADNNVNGSIDSGETMQYGLINPVTTFGSTVSDLQRTLNGQPVCYNIELLRFAYAFNDTNGDIDLNDPVNIGNVSWQFNNTATNTWFYVDTNNDGIINALDTNGGLNTGVAYDGSRLPRIKAMRVWMLVRSDKRDHDYVNSNTYVVGPTQFTPPANDHFRRTLLEITVNCRNMDL